MNIKKTILVAIVMPIALLGSCTSITRRLTTNNGKANPCALCTGTLTITQDFRITNSGDLQNFFNAMTADLSTGIVSGDCVEIRTEGDVDTISLPANLTTVSDPGETGVVINGNLDLTGLLTVSSGATLTVNGNLKLTYNLIVQPEATLIVNGNITTNNTVSNSGIITANNGTILFNGNASGYIYNGTNSTIQATGNNKIIFCSALGSESNPSAIQNNGSILAMDTGGEILFSNNTGATDIFFSEDFPAILNSPGAIIHAHTKIQFYHNQDGNGYGGAGGDIQNDGTIKSTTVIRCDNSPTTTNTIFGTGTIVDLSDSPLVPAFMICTPPTECP